MRENENNMVKDMKLFGKMITIAGVAAALTSCSDKAAQNGDFKYLMDEFADLKIMRYQVPGWDALTLQQKEYVYHLSEAAKYGRDIIWMQNCKPEQPPDQRISGSIHPVLWQHPAPDPTSSA